MVIYLEELAVKLPPRYLTYPRGNKPIPFVIQSHIRGKSQHLDFRFKLDNFLEGYSIVGGSVDDPILPSTWLEQIGKGFRVEFKARQPVVWLKLVTPKKPRRIVKPGEVGAGIEAPGEFILEEYGNLIMGALKPSFKEYFLKGTKVLKDWTRVVLRAVRVQRIDPITKKPTGKYEILWRLMVPREQEPYAISRRAREKKWIAPVLYPFPREWARRKFPSSYRAWLEWITGEKKLPLSKLESIYESKFKKGEIPVAKEPRVLTLEQRKVGRFSLIEHSYMGQVVIRAMPVVEWHLLIDDGQAKILDFKSEDENPLYVSPLAVSLEGRIAKKWLDFEGTLRAGEHWNPNKELESEVRILASGKCELIYDEVDGREQITLRIPAGAMKGEYVLLQEERDSPFYVFTSHKTLSMLELEGLVGKFVYDEHTIDGRTHYDIRILLPNQEFLWEFSGLDSDILKTREEQTALLKKCYDLSWIDFKFREGIKKVGPLKTFVKRIDQGEATVFNAGSDFWSFELLGKKFGQVTPSYLVARRQNRRWSLSFATLPQLSRGKGEPKTGEYYSPFKRISKRGWNYFLLRLYDLRKFTRMEPDEMTKLYFPKLKIPPGVILSIGLYPVPGQLHHVRVAQVQFPDTWSEEEARRWIIRNKLHTWTRERIVRR